MTATATPARSAYILPEGEDLDTLADVATVDVKVRSLRPGHVLTDDLDCPAAVIDHRIGASRGTVRYLVNDLDRGGWSEIKLHENGTVKVVAR